MDFDKTGRVIFSLPLFFPCRYSEMYDSEGSNAWLMYGRHLASFWSHYRVAAGWFRAQRDSHGYSTKELENLFPEYLCLQKKRKLVPQSQECLGEFEEDSARNSNNESVAESDVLSENMDESIDMSAEMVAFFRQTIEHRKQRDAIRKKEGLKKKYRTGNENDEYIMADKIGVYGNRKRSSRSSDTHAHHQRQKRIDEMRRLYGIDADKILAMELHLDFRFEQNYINDSYLWPNIPLKFKSVSRDNQENIDRGPLWNKIVRFVS